MLHSIPEGPFTLTKTCSTSNFTGKGGPHSCECDSSRIRIAFLSFLSLFLVAERPMGCAASVAPGPNPGLTAENLQTSNTGPVGNYAIAGAYSAACQRASCSAESTTHKGEDRATADSREYKKACRRKYDLRYRAANRVKLKEASRKYKAANREKHNDYEWKLYAANKENVLMRRWKKEQRTQKNTTRMLGCIEQRTENDTTSETGS